MSGLRRRKPRSRADVEHHIRHELRSTYCRYCASSSAPSSSRASTPPAGPRCCAVKGGCPDCDVSPATFMQGIETQLKLRIARAEGGEGERRSDPMSAEPSGADRGCAVAHSEPARRHQRHRGRDGSDIATTTDGKVRLSAAPDRRRRRHGRARGAPGARAGGGRHRRARGREGSSQAADSPRRSRAAVTDRARVAHAAGDGADAPRSALCRRADAGRVSEPRQHHRGLERQGRRRQVDGRRQPRGRARAAGRARRADGRRHLRPEHPADDGRRTRSRRSRTSGSSRSRRTA